MGNAIVGAILAFLSGPFIKILTGPFGKWLGISILIGFLSAGAAFALQAHDAAIRATLIANQSIAQAKSDAEQQQRVVTVLGTALAEQRAADAVATAAKQAIANVPDSQACAESAAIRAAIGGMFRDNPGATAGGARFPIVVPSPAARPGSK